MISLCGLFYCLHVWALLTFRCQSNETRVKNLFFLGGGGGASMGGNVLLPV